MKRDFLFLIVTFLVSVLVGFTSVSIAKYQWKENEDVAYIPSSFYFESDLLKTNSATYNLQQNTSEIQIVLKNHADELRFSSSDVSYTILIKKGGVVVSGQTKSGTITTIEKQESIIFSGLSSGAYEVVAQSTSPYTKTISATFIIPALNTAVQATIENQTMLGVVTVVTNDFSGTLTINFANSLVPDNTNPSMQGVTGNSFSLVVEKNSSYNLTFLKTVPSTNYTVSVSGSVVTIS